MKSLGVVAAVLLLIQDKKRDEYLVGWYSGLSPKHLEPMTDCNFVMPYTGKAADNDKRVQDYLDAAQKKGVQVMLEPLRDWIRQADTTALKAWAKKWKDHPALYGWYAYDEPEVAQPPAGQAHIVAPDKMALCYQAIKSVDPKKPVGIVFNNLQAAQKYVGCLDILMWDEYPAIANAAEFKYMAAWTRRLNQAADLVKKNGKQGLIVAVQGYGATHPEYGKREPTYNELRYMFYASVAVERSLGVLFFMDSWASENDKINISKILKEAGGIGLADIKKGALAQNGPTRTLTCGKSKIIVDTASFQVQIQR